MITDHVQHRILTLPYLVIICLIDAYKRSYDSNNDKDKKVRSQLRFNKI